MKKIRLSLIALFAIIGVLTLNSCGEKKAVAEDVQEFTVENILNEAEAMIDQEVVLEGVCTHICSHGGKKIFLMGEDETQTIRVEASDNIGAFSADCANAMVRVRGKVVEERIDEAYLAKWEASLEDGTVEEHGDEEEGGCASEQQAQNETPVSSELERIENFRVRIAEEYENTGKNYLSFYYILAESYEIE